MTNEEKHAILCRRLDAEGFLYSEEAPEKLLRYQMLLEEWNQRMNLTGDASFEALLDRHIMDSLTPLTIEDLFQMNAKVADVGSGAGFPGIPLAVLRPDLQITLLDSLQKRVLFLSQVIKELELTNVSAVHIRAEDAAQSPEYRGQFDVAAARAVAALPVLMELLLPFVCVGGKAVCYKGPMVHEELRDGETAANLLGGKKPRIIPVAVSGLPDYDHCLAVCKKKAETPKQYPRKAGVPQRKPLGERKGDTNQ